ncbi:MAG TPA: hypothetical protein VMW49_07015 [Candidatus Dormibacteraeota bacterium]|nr:hypothetical protein [Candidatus Dormibacteraeota bacterium]
MNPELMAQMVFERVRDLRSAARPTPGGRRGGGRARINAAHALARRAVRLDPQALPAPAGAAPQGGGGGAGWSPPVGA